MILSELLGSSWWDRQVVPKSLKLTTLLHCVKSQKITDQHEKSLGNLLRTFSVRLVAMGKIVLRFVGAFEF